jgi:ABC-type branched-subunit amino acid transport system ATPase component
MSGIKVHFGRGAGTKRESHKQKMVTSKTHIIRGRHLFQLLTVQSNLSFASDTIFPVRWKSVSG